MPLVPPPRVGPCPPRPGALVPCTPNELPGAAGVLTETESLSLGICVLTGSCGGAMSASCGEWLSDAAPSNAAAAAAAAPTAPSVTAENTARRTGRARRRPTDCPADACPADDRSAGNCRLTDCSADDRPADDRRPADVLATDCPAADDRSPDARVAPSASRDASAPARTPVPDSRPTTRGMRLVGTPFPATPAALPFPPPPPAPPPFPPPHSCCSHSHRSHSQHRILARKRTRDAKRPDGVEMKLPDEVGRHSISASAGMTRAAQLPGARYTPPPSASSSACRSTRASARRILAPGVRRGSSVDAPRALRALSAPDTPSAA